MSRFVKEAGKFISLFALSSLIGFTGMAYLHPKIDSSSSKPAGKIENKTPKVISIPFSPLNLERIIKEQEEKLGIKHFGVPEVMYLPYLPEGLLGIYNEKLNTIFIAINQHNMEETLDHELGHYYADGLHESLDLGNWPIFPGGKNDNIGVKLISEGIAEYFSRKLNNREDNFKDSDWPDNFDDFWTQRVIYSGGYHLVRPIIEEHGTNAIKYLILNTPGTNDLTNLPEYQKKCLKELEESSKQAKN